MKSKKKKDLALELVDDVLGVTETKQKKTKSKNILKKKKKKSDSSTSVSATDNQKSQITHVVVSDHAQEEKVAVGQSFDPSVPLRKDSPQIYLAQTENLKIAQEKILDLETEIERLRRENEELAAAGETFRVKADQIQSDLEKMMADSREEIDVLKNEKVFFKNSLNEKDKIVEEMKRQEQEYEMRLSSNIKKIRVRERELENRLEILKIENGAILRSKDEMILDLKRQLDHYETEITKYKDKVLELNSFLNEKKSDAQRTIKALKMGLNLLEGSPVATKIVPKLQEEMPPSEQETISGDLPEQDLEEGNSEE